MCASIFANGVRRRRRCDRLVASAAIAATLSIFGFGAASSQERPTLAPEDYLRWENLGRAALSPDGAWVAYGVETVDEQAELRIRSLERDSVRSVPWGRNPSFAPTGRWLAWAVGVSPDEEERLEEAEEPVQLGAGLLDLASGEERSFDEVRAFGFDSSGRFLALHGYAPDEPKGKGADLWVVDLASGTTTTLATVLQTELLERDRGIPLPPVASHGIEDDE
jgi:hypothetical protein